MGGEIDIEDRLRHWIVGRLHVGRLRSGDRLPSIRSTARETGVDHRAVADAYRALEEEGLVRIRPGSGVYVAAEERIAGVLSGTASWLAGVLAEGWSRRLPRGELGGLLSRCASTPLRCACVDSNEDHLEAIRAELEEDFSLETAAVLLDSDAPDAELAPERLAGVDLVVTTVFHADAVRASAAEADVPVVVASFNPELAAALDRRLREHPMTAVIVDPRFAARGEAYLSVTGHRGRVRYVTVDRLDREPELDLESERVAVTRAARRRLGLEEFHLVPPPPTVISAETARSLCAAIVRLTLEASS